MPKPILVGYDPSRPDPAPVQFGLAAAAFTGAQLIVGAVVADAAISEQAGHGAMSEDLADDAAGALDDLKSSLDVGDVEVDFRALGGRSAPSALHDAAESLDAGMLVLGSTQRGSGGLVRPGSTAERLMHGAPCPIAVVPGAYERGGGLKTIAVAYVDSPEGREAIDSAVALARRSGAHLRVLTAVRPRTYGKVGGDLPGRESSTFDEVGMAERAAERDAKQMIGDAGGVDYEVDVSAQDAADFLVAASENVDLLICGSRGYGPRRAVLLGGVSRRVTREAHCPVIVLTRGTEGQLRSLVDESTGNPLA